LLTLSGGLLAATFICGKFIVENSMKPSKFIVSLLSLFALFVMAATTTVQADETSQKIYKRPDSLSNKKVSQKAAEQAAKEAAKKAALACEVSYDKVTDHLNISAEAVSLKVVLGRVAQKSGIEVLFDDAAEENVSIDIQSSSLEDGIKNMLRGRNYMLRYNRDDQAKLMLIGVMVLPVGEQDSSRAKQLVPVESEAYSRAREQQSKPISVQQSQQIDASMDRWQARLSEMPVERREAMEKKVRARLEKEARKEQQRVARQEKQKQKMAEREEKRKKSREAMLQTLDPEIGRAHV